MNNLNKAKILIAPNAPKSRLSLKISISNQLLTFIIAVLLSLPLATTPSQAIPFPTNIHELKTHAVHLNVTRIAVFGKDNRKFISRRKSPITKKIGILYNQRTRTLCTAFCLDKSIIGTAAHCLFGRVGGARQKLRNFTFSLNHKRRGTTSHIAGARLNAADQHVITGSTRLRVRPPIDATKDWAIIKLARPVCRNGGLKVSSMKVPDVIKASNAKNIYQVAFHRDLKKWQLAHSQPCKVNRRFGKYRWKTIRQDFTRSNKLILHHCDTGGASSGSPLILKTKAGPTIIGINVGTYIQSKVLMRNGRVTKKFKPQTVANTGVSASVFNDAIANLKKARILTDKSSLEVVQTALRARTIYAGAIDGTYGALTRVAISEFEKNKGWPITGLPTRRLLAHFKSDIRTVNTPAMSESSARP